MTDSFTITREFTASPESVYAAWTTPELFSVWFGTAGVDVPVETVTMDVRVGGDWTAVMHLPDGPTINWEGRYREVVPSRRLVFTMTDQPGTDPGDPVVLEIMPSDAGSTMSLTQPGHGFSDEQIEQTVIGYNAFFDDMAQLLSE